MTLIVWVCEDGCNCETAGVRCEHSSQAVVKGTQSRRRPACGQ